MRGLYKHFALFFLVLILLVEWSFAFEKVHHYAIDVQKVTGENSRFWQACAHDFLFKLVNEPSGQALLDRFQQNKSMKYLRTHYTFSNQTKPDQIANGEIGGNVVTIDASGYEDLVNDEGFTFKNGVPADWQLWEATQEKLFIGRRDLCTAGNIPKPILTGFEMLAKLGQERLKVNGPQPGRRTGVIACRDDERQIQLLAYNYNETDDDLNKTDLMSIFLENLDGKKLVLKTCKMDRENNNTFHAWQQMGSPIKINDGIVDKLNQAGQLRFEKQRSYRIEDGRVNLKLNLQRHSMALTIIEVIG